jgi:L-threonate 2-dehydrogenase
LANAVLENVGIVGAGVMGFAIANNLQAAGHQVFGYDPVPGAQQRLRDIGSTAVGSPREVAEHCSTILFSLPSAAALIEAAGGENGVAKASRSGTIVIECSTLPLDVKRVALDALTASGKIMLDCPVSGTGAQAARKDLVIFGSGDADAFERSLPVARAARSRRLRQRQHHEVRRQSSGLHSQRRRRGSHGAGHEGRTGPRHPV